MVIVLDEYDCGKIAEAIINNTEDGLYCMVTIDFNGLYINVAYGIDRKDAWFVINNVQVSDNVCIAIDVDFNDIECNVRNYLLDVE